MVVQQQSLACLHDEVCQSKRLHSYQCADLSCESCMHKKTDVNNDSWMEALVQVALCLFHELADEQDRRSCAVPALELTSGE